jgi:hypothetical protein
MHMNKVLKYSVINVMLTRVRAADPKCSSGVLGFPCMIVRRFKIGVEQRCTTSSFTHRKHARLCSIIIQVELNINVAL